MTRRRQFEDPAKAIANLRRRGQEYALKGHRHLEHMTLLGRAVADGASSELSVFNIPPTHRHLMVMFRGSVSTGSYVAWNCRFPSSGTTTDHRYTVAWDAWNGSSVTRTGEGSGGASRFPVAWLATSDLTTGSELWIPHYTTLGSAIPFWWQGWASISPSSARSFQGAGFWLNPEPGGVSAIRTNAASGNLEAGSSIDVYGVGLVD